MNKLRVGLIYGGRSGEHEISLQTAHAVVKAFDYEKYEILPFYITKDGEWRKGKYLTGPVDSPKQLVIGEEQGERTAIESVFNRLALQNEGYQSNPEYAEQIDLAFPLLHGTFGEDGTIQGLFEMAGIPYVGAGVLSSAVGMDKVVMKKLFAQEGLPQCLYRSFNRQQWSRDQGFFIMEVEVSLGYPCFVKPANLGSSVGISKAKNRDEFIQAVDEAFKYDNKLIVEEFVDAREIEIGILGNEEPEASVPGEVKSSGEFYDYKAKYVDGKSAMIIPAELRPEVAVELRELAIRAFQAIDGSGLARVDFFVRREDDRIFLNEINTMPGFTPFSMYPLLWKESGKSYSELLNRLIELALRRYDERQRIQYDFDEG